jgi:hypothetical protein
MNADNKKTLYEMLTGIKLLEEIEAIVEAHKKKTEDLFTCAFTNETDNPYDEAFQARKNSFDVLKTGENEIRLSTPYFQWDEEKGMPYTYFCDNHFEYLMKLYLNNFIMGNTDQGGVQVYLNLLSDDNPLLDSGWEEITDKRISFFEEVVTKLKATRAEQDKDEAQNQ